MTLPKVPLAEVPVRVLFINGSPRARSNTGWLIDQAIAGAQSLGNVETEVFSFKGKKMAYCKGCTAYCEKHKKCVSQDAFEELTPMWLRADGIVWGAPVYTFGPPAQVRAWMDRFGEIFFQNMRGKNMPLLRFLKPTGIMVQGSSEYGGQEIAAQSFIEHVVLTDCIAVSGDMPHSDQAVLGRVIDRMTPASNEGLLRDAYAMGRRVAEMSKLIKLGKLALGNSLPDVYWYSPTQLGAVERPAAAGAAAV